MYLFGFNFLLLSRHNTLMVWLKIRVMVATITDKNGVISHERKPVLVTTKMAGNVSTCLSQYPVVCRLSSLLVVITPPTFPLHPPDVKVREVKMSISDASVVCRNVNC